jgi:microcin C transport system permease protein
MGLSYNLRGATYGERSRDYVSAARLLGAGNTRIIFRHILPNILSILVTKLPFTVEALIASLTALDFLGFGLPPGEPSWGSLLKDGTDNMNAPWILYSAFAAIVVTLILITFVGEAIREAFDPKRFTVYR